MGIKNILIRTDEEIKRDQRKAQKAKKKKKGGEIINRNNELEREGRSKKPIRINVLRRERNGR